MTQNEFNFILSHGGVGILEVEDVEGLRAGTHRVFELLKDGEWHTRSEICQAAGKNGIPAAEGTRRLRDLRPMLSSQGFKIELEKIENLRQFKYRIAKKEVGES